MTTTSTTSPVNRSGIEPDDLLAGIRHSILGLAIVISTVVHLILIGVTSFGLYRDWGEFGLHSAEYGFHTPSVMNQIKTARQRAADDEARRVAAEEKAAAAAAVAAAAANNATAGTAEAAAGNTNTLDAAPVTPPELEPLPPKADFNFGEDLQL